MDVAVERNDCDLLSLVVVAERPDPIGLLALLFHQRPREEIGRDFGACHFFQHLIGDSPQGHTAIARPRHYELVVNPSHVEDPVGMRPLSQTRGIMVRVIH